MHVNVLIFFTESVQSNTIYGKITNDSNSTNYSNHKYYQIVPVILPSLEILQNESKKRIYM
jgi:hypothetical protein